MNKIGLFSGTFDPIHVGHIKACLSAKAVCGLEQVLVLVEQKPHRKQKVTNYQERKNMVELAISDFKLINFFDTNEPNITFDTTLPILKKRFPGVVFVMIVGSDMLEHMTKWGNIDSVELCVVLRDDKVLGESKTHLKTLKKSHPKLKATILPPVEATVSSSIVRKQIASNGHGDGLHRRVIEYINQQQLYAGSSPRSK